MKFPRLRFFADTEARSAAENMALDEALFLLEAFPVVRSYGWIRPAVSFGYFTPWNFVAPKLVGRDFVRRWTGGGLVEHGDDFTYSLILPELHPGTNVDLYRLIHDTLAELLRECGHPVEVCQSGDALDSNVCFEKAVKFDLKVCGEKIAGAAIRRNRRGVLLQGSIQHIEIPDYFTSTFAKALAERIETFTLSKPIMETMTRVAKEKYEAAEWTHRF
jgi:lipoyl(octanoyl) transferase